MGAISARYGTPVRVNVLSGILASAEVIAAHELSDCLTRCCRVEPAHRVGQLQSARRHLLEHCGRELTCTTLVMRRVELSQLRRVMMPASRRAAPYCRKNCGR